MLVEIGIWSCRKLFVFFFDPLMDLLKQGSEKSEIRAQLWGNCASGGRCRADYGFIENLRV
jgi:hypothetical protein